jgi:hypothetical protein
MLPRFVSTLVILFRHRLNVCMFAYSFNRKKRSLLQQRLPPWSPMLPPASRQRRPRLQSPRQAPSKTRRTPVNARASKTTLRACQRWKRQARLMGPKGCGYHFPDKEVQLCPRMAHVHTVKDPVMAHVHAAKGPAMARVHRAKVSAMVHVYNANNLIGIWGN